MKEQFVTPQIAIKLKNLGFDEECLAKYKMEADNKLHLRIVKNKSGKIRTYKPNGYSLLAPLWQQVIDWLETKGFYISISRIFEWNVKPPKFEGWCVYLGNKNPEISFDCNSYFLTYYYPTKEEAREQAILKAIELCKNE